MITLNKLDNGDLQIILDDRDDFELMKDRPYPDERAYLSDMLDSGRYLGNDWGVPYNLGLTEVPAIAEGLEWDDDGNLVDMDSLWIYPQYMLHSFMEELEEFGTVTFKKHRL